MFNNAVYFARAILLNADYAALSGTFREKVRFRPHDTATLPLAGASATTTAPLYFTVETLEAISYQLFQDLLPVSASCSLSDTPTSAALLNGAEDGREKERTPTFSWKLSACPIVSRADSGSRATPKPHSPRAGRKEGKAPFFSVPYRRRPPPGLAASSLLKFQGPPRDFHELELSRSAAPGRAKNRTAPGFPGRRALAGEKSSWGSRRGGGGGGGGAVRCRGSAEGSTRLRDAPLWAFRLGGGGCSESPMRVPGACCGYAVFSGTLRVFWPPDRPSD